MLATLLFCFAVALGLRLTWNPGYRSYLEYVPIGGVLAAFLWDRAFPSPSRTHRRHIACDLAALGLALLRVIAPPLPFVSGHTLFAAYAALTARGRTLRWIAVVVLAQVVHWKLFVAPGWPSMAGGLALAAVLFALRRGSDPPTPPGGRPA